MKRLNKITLALVLLGIVSVILAVHFSSQILGIVSIAFLTTAGVKWSNEITGDVIQLGKESATLSELLDERLSEKPKVKAKVLNLTPEQKAQLADQFIREIGSDTGPISLKKK